MRLRESCLWVSALVLGCGAGAASTSPAARPATTASPAFAVGYAELRLQDPARQRPVWIDLWYPAAPTAKTTPLRYGLATGSAARDAAPVDDQPRTLLVFSHGAGGSATDCAWLTEHLASHGYIVAGVNHYGESRVYGVSTVDRLALLRSWTRPADLHFAIAALFANEAWGPRLRPDRVGGLGHSAGGHALLVLAGATYDELRLATYCKTGAAQHDRGCTYASGLRPEDWAAVGRRPEGPLPTDSRLAALFLMEPAMGPSFEAADLRKVSAAADIVATRPGDFLPFEPHAAHIARLLPHASLEILEGSAGHFVFLAECDLPIDVMGVPLCADARGVDRKAVHQHVTALARGFFARTLE